MRPWGRRLPSARAIAKTASAASQQQSTPPAPGGAGVPMGDLSGTTHHQLQSPHYPKNPAQNLAPGRYSTVCDLCGSFSNLCDTILLWTLSGRVPSLVTRCRCLCGPHTMEGSVGSMADGLGMKRQNPYPPKLHNLVGAGKTDLEGELKM